jgi:hypothetical protein
MMLGRRALLLGAANAAAPCAVAQPFGDATLGPLTGRAPGGVAGNLGPRGPASLPPTLDLNFMTGPPLDPRITFTRASTATYFNAAGTLQAAATNAPRFDYDPVTHALRGLLIEEQRVNMLFPSVPDTTVWSGGTATVTIGAGTAPDGTATATQVAETTANAMHYVVRSPIATTSTGPQTLSLYAKANGTRYLQVSLDDSGSGTIGGYATFDLQAGVVSGALTARGAAVIGTAAIQSAGNGFYRCSITVTTTGAALNDRVLLMLSNVGAPAFSPSYVGNAANSLLLWGVQLEVGAFATSYIPTTAAAVTRSADLSSIPPANMGFFVSPGGSWAAEFINSDPAGDRSARIIGIHDASGITPMWQTTAFTLSSYDGLGVNTVNTVVANSITKGATTWASGNGQACLNGGPVAVAAMGAGFAALATSGISLLGGNPGVLNESMTGYIRRVRYWPRVLSNSELQSVTT